MLTLLVNSDNWAWTASGKAAVLLAFLDTSSFLMWETLLAWDFPFGNIWTRISENLAAWSMLVFCGCVLGEVWKSWRCLVSALLPSGFYGQWLVCSEHTLQTCHLLWCAYTQQSCYLVVKWAKPVVYLCCMCVVALSRPRFTVSLNLYCIVHEREFMSRASWVIL